MPTNNKWINETKSFASKNNISYGEALNNTKNREQYYDSMIDRTKFYRGPNMLQPDHPSKKPFIPGESEADRKLRDEIHIQTKRHMAGLPVKFKK
jgi:hypothetical protein